MKFFQIFRKVRLEHNLTHKGMARKLGLSENYVKGLEGNSLRCISPALLVKFKKLAGRKRGLNAAVFEQNRRADKYYAVYRKKA